MIRTTIIKEENVQLIVLNHYRLEEIDRRFRSRETDNTKPIIVPQKTLMDACKFLPVASKKYVEDRKKLEYEREGDEDTINDYMLALRQIAADFPTFNEDKHNAALAKNVERRLIRIRENDIVLSTDFGTNDDIRKVYWTNHILAEYVNTQLQNMPKGASVRLVGEYR